MLLYLADYLSQFHTGFNVIQYLTLRTIFGVLVRSSSPFDRSLHDSTADLPSDRTDGAHRRPAVPSLQSRHPDHGGALLLVAVTISFAVGGLGKPVRLGGDYSSR